MPKTVLLAVHLTLFFDSPFRIARPAQAPAELRLKGPQQQLTAEFTRIVGIRELLDERVLIADAGENRLLVADFSLNMVTPIARSGSGPAEFQRVSALIALPSDSTLMADPGDQGRLLLLSGSKVVATISPQANPFRARYALPLGADAAGRILAGLLPIGGSQTPRVIDSLVLVAANRVTGRGDTLAKPAQDTQAPHARSAKWSSFEILLRTLNWLASLGQAWTRPTFFWTVGPP